MSEDEWFVTAMQSAPRAVGGERCVDSDPFDAGRLWAFKFGDSQSDAVATHLAACPHCRGLMRAMTPATPERLDRLAGPAPPDRRGWLATAAGLTLAAGAGLWWALRPAAPTYRAGPLAGAEKGVRGATDGSVFLPRNTLRWRLTPAVPTADVTVRVEAVGPSGTRRPLTAEVSPSGVVSIEVKAAEAFGEEYGAWTLRAGLSVGGATAWHTVEVEYRAAR